MPSSGTLVVDILEETGIPQVNYHDNYRKLDLSILFVCRQVYSESKWVVERVPQNVTQQHGLHTVVMGLGQVAGDRAGYWSEREWFPCLVKSALFQKCLPKDDAVRLVYFVAY